MTKNGAITLLALALAACTSRPGAAADTKAQLTQIQTQLQIMQDDMARMEQSFNERMGVMKDMVKQQSEDLNKMGVTVQTLQKTLGQQTTVITSRVDDVSGQMQALQDAVDELKARMAKLSRQLDDIQTAQQNIPVGSTAPNAALQGPPPAGLYNAAMSDYEAGKNDLASQEFSQYLQLYKNTDLAGDAQFYLGEIQYRQRDLQGAIDSYNKVLDQYPLGNKAAPAELKIAFALLDLGERAQGAQELHNLIDIYPESPEALQAKARLSHLRVRKTAPKPARSSPGHNKHPR